MADEQHLLNLAQHFEDRMDKRVDGLRTELKDHITLLLVPLVKTVEDQGKDIGSLQKIVAKINTRIVKWVSFGGGIMAAFQFAYLVFKEDINNFLHH